MTPSPWPSPRGRGNSSLMGVQRIHGLLHPPVNNVFELRKRGADRLVQQRLLRRRRLFEHETHDLGTGCRSADAETQAALFAREAALRAARGLPPPLLDQLLLAALDSGLPPCAGVALGIDRLLMLALGATDLSPVMAFGRDLI